MRNGEQQNLMDLADFKLFNIFVLGITGGSIISLMWWFSIRLIYSVGAQRFKCGSQEGISKFSDEKYQARSGASHYKWSLKGTKIHCISKPFYGKQGIAKKWPRNPLDPSFHNYPGADGAEVVFVFATIVLRHTSERALGRFFLFSSAFLANFFFVLPFPSPRHPDIFPNNLKSIPQ